MKDLRRYQQLSDEALLAKFEQSGDNNLLGIVLQRHTAFFISIAYKYLQDQSLAEDAVQHVMMQTIDKYPTTPITNFKGWFYILLRNHCLSMLKQKKHLHILEEQHIPIHFDERDESDPRGKEKTYEQMLHLMNNLPSAQQECLEYFYLKDKSYQQIAAITGYGLNQIKSHIQNGKRKLRLLMIQQKLGPQ